MVDEAWAEKFITQFSKFQTKTLEAIIEMNEAIIVIAKAEIRSREKQND